jgi:hypothetical protein
VLGIRIRIIRQPAAAMNYGRWPFVNNTAQLQNELFGSKMSNLEELLGADGDGDGLLAGFSGTPAEK